MKLPAVNHLGGLFGLGVILVLDAQFVDRLDGRELSVAGRLDQGDEPDLAEVLGDAVAAKILAV